MTRPYKQYGPQHFEEIKPIVVQGMIDKFTVKEMAKRLDMKFKTLAIMLFRNGLHANTVRHQHKQGKDVFK